MQSRERILARLGLVGELRDAGGGAVAVEVAVTAQRAVRDALAHVNRHGAAVSCALLGGFGELAEVQGEAGRERTRFVVFLSLLRRVRAHPPPTQ